MMDKIKYLGKFEFGLCIDVPTILPDKDKAWECLISLRTYLQKLEPLLVQMEKTIEEQQIEIEKLKLDKANRVQKIEIVKFLDQTEIPKPPQPFGGTMVDRKPSKRDED